MEGAALRAMTRGTGPLKYGPASAKKVGMKKRRRRRKSRARYSSPLHKILAIRRSVS